MQLTRQWSDSGPIKKEISRRYSIPKQSPQRKWSRKGRQGKHCIGGQCWATSGTLWLLLNVAIVLSEWTFQSKHFLSTRTKHTTKCPVFEQDKNALLAEMLFDQSACSAKKMQLHKNIDGCWPLIVLGDSQIIAKMDWLNIDPKTDSLYKRTSNGCLNRV